MSRPSCLAVASLVAMVAFPIGAVAVAAAPKKARSSRPFPIGSEATIIVVGDEVRLLPALGRATVVAPDSLVLVTSVPDEGSPATARRLAFQSDLEFGRAIRTADPEGIREMIARGRAFRVKTGTRVRVLDVILLGTDRIVVADRLPFDRHGKRLVRILEGVDTGKLAEIPTRNLRGIDEPSRKDEPPPKPGPDPARRAATLLSTARNLEKLKKTRGALEIYRQILREYPALPEAQEAGDRLKQLGGQWGDHDRPRAEPGPTDRTGPHQLRSGKASTLPTSPPTEPTRNPGDRRRHAHRGRKSSGADSGGWPGQRPRARGLLS